MENWRYDSLRTDLNRLEKELREVRQWRDLLPLRVMTAVMWLMAVGTAVAMIVMVALRH
jgi:hypothetical protein